MDRLPSGLRRRRSQIAILATAALLTVSGGAWLAWPSGAPAAAGPTPTPRPSATAAATASPRATSMATPSPTPEPVADACPLNGLPLADPGALDRTALAVQIDDHPGARPARNLTRADMVFEATVEGSTTRFTAVYLCQPTEGLTGPIRSARYYNIDLWQDVGVLTMGFGASTKTRARFTAAGMPYLNGITGSWPWFRRFGSYAAPHNLYGDVEAVRAALGQNAALDALSARIRPLRPPFSFAADAEPPTGRPVASVEIRTNPYWRIGWRWDPAGSAWRRLDGGAEISDAATGEPVRAVSVIVQRVSEEVVTGDPDPGGNPRRLHHLVGEGTGTLYVEGRAIDLRWSRPSAADGTRWTYAADGEPVILPPGQVWWQIIPIAAGISEG